MDHSLAGKRLHTWILTLLISLPPTKVINVKNTIQLVTLLLKEHKTSCKLNASHIHCTCALVIHGKTYNSQDLLHSPTNWPGCGLCAVSSQVGDFWKVQDSVNLLVLARLAWVLYRGLEGSDILQPRKPLKGVLVDPVDQMERPFHWRPAWNSPACWCMYFATAAVHIPVLVDKQGNMPWATSSTKHTWS